MSGWTNVGAVVTATELILVNAEGVQDGQLDGINGLVLYGTGSATDPAFKLDPIGHLFWNLLNPNQTSPTELSASGGTGIGAQRVTMTMNSGAVNNEPAAEVVAYSATQTGNAGAGVMVAPLMVGQDLTASTPTIETWHTPTLDNGWTNANNQVNNIGYRNMGDGTCMFTGSLTGGTTTDGTVIMQINTAYAPAKIVPLVVSTMTGLARIEVFVSGNVECFGLSAGAQINLDGVRFPMALLTP